MKHWLIISVLAVLMACGDEAPDPIPADVMEKEDMIPLIVDLQILESHFQRQFGRVDLFKSALDSSSESIFVDHGVDRVIYEKSLNFYAENPDTLYVIYEAALDTINFRLDRMNSIDNERSVIQIDQ
ncbi:DUF4296 domain-containing protein [Crocinitomicaceae bacterium]|jgi:hypothetical protein|nr:DUF4296 domain-containing protein [Crocinitomicaceae bacterium]